MDLQLFGYVSVDDAKVFCAEVSLIHHLLHSVNARVHGGDSLTRLQQTLLMIDVHRAHTCARTRHAGVRALKSTPMPTLAGTYKRMV